MDKDYYRKQAENGKRWCYDCANFYYEGYFCGYNACSCKIYGSLDVDQKERHPDETADICKEYTPNGKDHWYEKY